MITSCSLLLLVLQKLSVHFFLRGHVHSFEPTQYTIHGPIQTNKAVDSKISHSNKQQHTQKIWYTTQTINHQTVQTHTSSLNNGSHCNPLHSSCSHVSVVFISNNNPASQIPITTLVDASRSITLAASITTYFAAERR